MHACKQWFYIALAVNTVVKKVDFVKHTFTVHSVEPSFFYVCGIQRCLQGFKCGASFSSFKTHAIRRHPNWQEQNLTVFLRLQNSVNHRVFERKWRSRFPPGARLSERSFPWRAIPPLPRPRGRGRNATVEASSGASRASLEVTAERFPPSTPPAGAVGRRVRRRGARSLRLGGRVGGGAWPRRALGFFKKFFFLNLRSGETTR